MRDDLNREHERGEPLHRACKMSEILKKALRSNAFKMVIKNTISAKTSVKLQLAVGDSKPGMMPIMLGKKDIQSDRAC